MSLSGAQSSSSESVSTVVYQYNSKGTVRALMQDSAELLLDMKLVQQSQATPEYLTTVGGQAGEAREAGFELCFVTAADVGLETLNESTGQWRSVCSTTTFAISARLPN